MELLRSWPHDVVGCGKSEGDEQQSGLIHVPCVLIDDRDVQLVTAVGCAQTVGGERSACSGSQNDNSCFHRYLDPFRVEGEGDWPAANTYQQPWASAPVGWSVTTHSIYTLRAEMEAAPHVIPECVRPETRVLRWV